MGSQCVPSQSIMPSRIAVVVVTATVLELAAAFKYCGNFCGPDWCAASVTPECSNVVGNGCAPGASCNTQAAQPTSPPDACCKLHDECCGSSDRTGCNAALKSCLEGGLVVGEECDSIKATAMWALFSIKESDCCGSACSAWELELRANRTVVV